MEGDDLAHDIQDASDGNGSNDSEEEEDRPQAAGFTLDLPSAPGGDSKFRDNNFYLGYDRGDNRYVEEGFAVGGRGEDMVLDLAGDENVSLQCHACSAADILQCSQARKMPDMCIIHMHMWMIPAMCISQVYMPCIPGSSSMQSLPCVSAQLAVSSSMHGTGCKMGTHSCQTSQAAWHRHQKGCTWACIMLATVGGVALLPAMNTT